MDSKDYKNELDFKILSLAEKILDSEIGIAEGCRKMFNLLNERGIGSEKDFLIFAGVESEMDTFPVGSERQYWNKEQLKLKDQEMKVVEKYYGKQVFEACRKLIKFLKNN